MISMSIWPVPRKDVVYEEQDNVSKWIRKWVLVTFFAASCFCLRCPAASLRAVDPGRQTTPVLGIGQVGMEKMMRPLDPVEIARALFDHPAFNHGSYNRFDRPDNEWVRQHWTAAVLAAMGAASRPVDPECFARALYEYPQWGYKQPFGKNKRVAAPWRQAVADVLADAGEVV